MAEDKETLLNRLLWVGSADGKCEAVSRSPQASTFGSRRGRRRKGRTTIAALAEREQFSLEFPNVEGFIVAKEALRCDVTKIAPLHIEAVPPTSKMASDATGWRVVTAGTRGGHAHTLSRAQFLESNPLHATVSRIAHDVVEALAGGRTIAGVQSTTRLRLKGARVFREDIRGFVKDYLETRVSLGSAAARVEDIALALNRDAIVGRLLDTIELDTDSAEPVLLPRLASKQATFSTSAIRFETGRPTIDATKTHASSVVIVDEAEENTVRVLVDSENVAAFVKNDQPHFGIAYEWKSEERTYAPDYLVRMVDGTTWVLEMEKPASDEDESRWQAARKWIRALNNDGSFGSWKLVVCKSPEALRQLLAHPAPVLGSADDCVTDKPFIPTRDREWWDRPRTGNHRKKARTKRGRQWAMDPPFSRRRWAVPCRCRKPWCDGVRYVNESGGEITVRLMMAHPDDPAVEHAMKQLVSILSRMSSPPTKALPIVSR